MMNETAKKTISQTMKDHLGVVDIQIKSCELFINIIANGMTYIAIILSINNETLISI